MYESPISEMLGEIQTRIIEQQENRVLQAVQNCGISVDKEELIKALMYDRQQYEKGYADAKKIYERKKGEWERTSFYNDTPICSECYLEGRWDWDFCPNCGADMRGEENETD